MDARFEFYEARWITTADREILQVMNAGTMLEALGFAYPAMKSSRPMGLHAITYNAHLKMVTGNQPNILDPSASFQKRYEIMNYRGGAWNLLKQWYLVGLLAGVLGDFNMTANTMGGLVMTGQQLESEALFSMSLKYVFGLGAQMMRNEYALEQLYVAAAGCEEIVRGITKYSEETKWLGLSVTNILRHLGSFHKVPQTSRNKETVKIILEGYVSALDDAFGNNFRAADWISERLDEI